MKSKRPIHIIQIFDNSYEYGKDEKSFSERKEKTQWYEKIISKSGYIENEKLKLNKSKLKFSSLNNINLILLIDYNSGSESEILEKFKYLKIFDYADHQFSNELKKHSLKREFLNRIEYIKTGEISLYPFLWKCFRFESSNLININLIWDEWEIGLPKRDNFKLCALEANKPIEININGKRDFSMSGRKERTFIERNFIIEYLGEINEYEFIKDPNIEFEKEIPKATKRINLLKELF
ncbi:MAG: hypothetical protein H6589_02390 [Flavobacteriales bacterium]|nr:hypothetical protein [Flavobacteriales bacterium]